jgi:hypothetical protein
MPTLPKEPQRIRQAPLSVVGSQYRSQVRSQVHSQVRSMDHTVYRHPIRRDVVLVKDPGQRGKGQDRLDMLDSRLLIALAGHIHLVLLGHSSHALDRWDRRWCFRFAGPRKAEVYLCSSFETFCEYCRFVKLPSEDWRVRMCALDSKHSTRRRDDVCDVLSNLYLKYSETTRRRSLCQENSTASTVFKYLPQHAGEPLHGQ